MSKDSTSYIFGKVIDFKTQEPIISGLNISLFKEQKFLVETQTDFDGNFKFKNVLNGSYSIKYQGIKGFEEIFVPKLIVENNQKIQILISQDGVWLYQNSWHGKTHSVPLIPDTTRTSRRN